MCNHILVLFSKLEPDGWRSWQSYDALGALAARRPAEAAFNSTAAKYAYWY